MKTYGHRNSTKTRYGEFDFGRSTTAVKPHIRSMPVKKVPMAPSMDTDMDGMAKGGVLDAASRNAIPKSQFGLPGSRKYPMPDRSHAQNAKARATQMVNAGKLSESAKAQIDRKANAVLAKAKGGQVSHDEPMIKAAVHKHERHDHPGEPLTKLRRGGPPGC